MHREELKNRLIDALKAQGFKINPHVQPTTQNKFTYRYLQQTSRLEQISFHKKFLKANAKKVKEFLLNINNFNPHNIDLELREVKPDSIEELIFKWWNLVWWSVPYQRAYGRQMRFVLWDIGHNAPFGFIGLQSPVLKMAVRDNYLNIPKDELDLWVNKSMQAQRLGALPPYNYLIGGKMTALAMTSNELRKCYREKYKNYKTEIQGRIIEPELLFITTTSAFGKSSIYNRLKYKNQPVAKSLGYTKGAGSFHIPENLYKEIREFLKDNGVNVSTTFGNGPSRKIKLLYTAFRLLKVPDYSYHNLKREFFLFPLASNLQDIIQKKETPIYYNRPLKDLVDFWKERWCLPRAERKEEWKRYKGEFFFNQLLQKHDLN
ncbi:MAG TPA: DUF4338 domain-containing protein [Bacteroidales bacterium]|nr:DUF4338 domain-containing protein [Bacteroidales bacterium]